MNEVETKKLDELKERLLGNHTTVTAEYRTMLRESMKYIIPRFERTRAVRLVQMSDGTWVLVCSCRLWKTRRYACRHIYRVLRRNPKLSDANVRWQNGYRQNYGRHEELTEAFMNIRDAELPGIIVTNDEVASIKSRMHVGCGDRDKHYFLCSYKKLYLRGSDTFWHENATRLHHVLGDSVCCVPVKQPAPAAAPTALLSSTTVSTTLHSQNGAAVGDQPLTTFGATKMLHHSSTYVVPSQRRGHNCGADPEIPVANDNFVDEVDVKSKKVDLTERFRPRYAEICKFADSAGEDGVVVMAKHFNNCQRRFLNFFNNSTVREDEVPLPPPPKSRSTPYIRFDQPFQAICRMAQRTGDAGIEAVSETLTACQQELVVLVDGKMLSNKKTDSRLKMVTER